uniref:Probable ubiquitin carboxyl-terminal hydrolase FAF-X n=1 Tax=Dermatophagoides pteronyssinus TaxID=6956 RepID=A0A6P6YF04_DERPT|nr:probable ubiquitin carboxyl-terminal hydrolase FAF-X [Dermatophagoides pteronyssinus]
MCLNQQQQQSSTSTTTTTKLFELLSQIFSTSNRFAFVNCNEQLRKMYLPLQNQLDSFTMITNEQQQQHLKNSLLIILIEYFGHLNGFECLLSLFVVNRCDNSSLSSYLIYIYLQPFENCLDFLSNYTLESYFLKIFERILHYFNQLTDDEFKNELKTSTETKINANNNADLFGSILKKCKNFLEKLSSTTPVSTTMMIKSFDYLRLKFTLRTLQLSSFSGKMNSLNELNKIISNYILDDDNNNNNYSKMNPSTTNETLALTSNELAKWLCDNNVVDIVLNDCLHHTQYVEKLDQIFRFLLKENQLTLDYLDHIWNSQLGKHEIIVKNIHELIAKLAWHFSPKQLDHLFSLFQSSWSIVVKKEREKLLQLMRRLAEDDKYGSMANKMLILLWNIAYNHSEIDVEIVDQAICSHLKILDYSKTFEKDSQRFLWIKRCIMEIQNSDYGNNVLTSMKHIKEILLLFPENNSKQYLYQNQNDNCDQNQQQQRFKRETRQFIINQMNLELNFLKMLIKNLSNYMKWKKSTSTIDNGNDDDDDPNQILIGRRFSHCQEIYERLGFLRFIIQQSKCFLPIELAQELWNCLAIDASFACDRQFCFQWFSSLMDLYFYPTNQNDDDGNGDGDNVNNEDEYLENFLEFLQKNLSKFNPELIDIYGVECFEKFFITINCQHEKLIHLNDNSHQTNDCDLIGLDYLWKLILFSRDQLAARKAIELIEYFFTNLGPKLIESRMVLNQDFLNVCFDQLKCSYDTVTIIAGDDNQKLKIKQELTKMLRILSVLCEFIRKSYKNFRIKRTKLSLSELIRGKSVELIVKISIQTFNNNLDELVLQTHTNESITVIRDKILEKCNMNNDSNIKVKIAEPFEKEDISELKKVSDLTMEKRFCLSVKVSQEPNTIDWRSDLEFSNQSFQKFYKPDMVDEKIEQSLPGVIMSENCHFINFLFQISDLAMLLKNDNDDIRKKCLEILQLMPPDKFFRKMIIDSFINHQENPLESSSSFEQELLSSPTKTIYLLEIIFTLIMPVNDQIIYQESIEFQKSFIKSGYCLRILSFLNDKKFLETLDNYYQIRALYLILKISKFTLLTYCFLKEYSEGLLSDKLREILRYNCEDYLLKNLANITAIILYKESNDSITKQFIPENEQIYALIRIAWFMATGNQQQINQLLEMMFDVCQLSLETITLMLLLEPKYSNFLSKSICLRRFFIDLLLIQPIETIRITMAEQFSFIILINLSINSSSSSSINIGSFILELIFNYLQTYLLEFYQTSRQFFQFCCQLLEIIILINKFIEYEYNLLSCPKENFYIDGHYQEILLEGHLSITKVLVSKFLSLESKCKIGLGDRDVSSEQFGLVNRLLDQYLFTASKSLCLFRQNSDIFIADIYPVCSGSQSMIAAYELLAAFCDGCLENLEFICRNLESYLNTMVITSWDYFPNIAMRPENGFVGLKNAGATCYMNSVLQQLFMIPEVRNGILSVKIDYPYHFSINNNMENNSTITTTTNQQEEEQQVKAYNIEIFQQIQIIFGHLLSSQAQYYVPKGFWEHFKLFGGKMHLKEQQDALEFFNGLFDILDEAMKALKQPSIMTPIFGGSFSDQKICKDCPHRYFREEPFTTLNVDVRNHHTLNDSLEQYVHGDLLEGDNAYHCEKCDRKVNTVKRLCIKRLPKILVIQLKRFGYDFDRDVSIKFNDYFEFPRLLNMEPYTVNGLARKEGEIIEEDDLNNQEQNLSTEYELNGIVVHSGQASGGHYYSYILHQTESSNDNCLQKKWYKFDDTDVSECKLDQDDEMRNQCFGGEYMSEYYDQLMKKSLQRLQKRWWNAFILVYRKIDNQKQQQPKSVINPAKIPLAITKNVQHQNTLFIHQRTLFSEEFYHFIKILIDCNRKNLNFSTIPTEKLNRIIMETLNMAAKFLIRFGFKAKKSLRFNAHDWYESLIPYLQHNSSIRSWFIANHLMLNANKLLNEFLLQCPSLDVRIAFEKLIIFLIRYSILDQQKPQQQEDTTTTITESTINPFVNEIMSILLSFIQKDFVDCSRQSTQYFHLIYSYAILGIEQRKHLLLLSTPSLFITFVNDRNFSITKSTQTIDNRLYQVVSYLVRSCDPRMIICSQFSESETYQPLSNPFQYDDNNIDVVVNVVDGNHQQQDNDHYIMEMPKDLYEKLYQQKSYIKHILNEAISLNENLLLLKFCSWENQLFSLQILDELLLQLNNSYTTYELEPYFYLLRDLLLLEDSIQHYRIQVAIFGDHLAEKSHSYYDNNRSKCLLSMLTTKHSLNFEKKVYQCLELLSYLLKHSTNIVRILNENPLKQQLFQVIKNMKTFTNESSSLKNNNDCDFNMKWPSLSSTPTTSTSTSLPLSIETVNLLNEVESYFQHQAFDDADAESNDNVENVVDDNDDDKNPDQSEQQTKENLTDENQLSDGIEQMDISSSG